MPSKLDIYNLSTIGVQLVESLIHAPDGAFLAAQNGAISQIDGEGGLSKRGGLAKLNAVAANGAILAGINVPLTDPDA